MFLKLGMCGPKKHGGGTARCFFRGGNDGYPRASWNRYAQQDQLQLSRMEIIYLMFAFLTIAIWGDKLCVTFYVATALNLFRKHVVVMRQILLIR